LNEALGWIGSRVDDVYGAAIGRLEDVWIDPATGEARWLLVKEGRFGGRSTLVPFSQATAGDGNVWIPYERSVVREAPQIEPGVPLTQQVEATLRNHYAANAAAAVSHGAQPPEREEGAEGGQDSRATRATVRLATATPPPEPEPMPPPQLPLRPAPPVDAPPPGPEPQAFSGYEPQSQQQPQHQQPPPPQQPVQPAPQPAQPQPQPGQPPPPQQAQPGYRYQPPPEPGYGYEPPAPIPSPPPPQAQQPFGYEPPPLQQAPPPPPEPDPLDVLAGLPPGHMIEIELSGSLTISGELRHARIVPPDDPSFRR
jgi:sporulation protein YlmC with PRC-barrel domain